MKSIINGMLATLDAKLVRKSSHDALISRSKNHPNRVNKYRHFELASRIDSEYLPVFFECVPHSKSQLSQDLFALAELNFKRGGFFVEFGATNGIDLSNTHLMEARLDWGGILAEPARIWHSSLLQNRSASVETDCVWSVSNDTLVFNEVDDDFLHGELSTIDAFSDSDTHRDSRSKYGKKYEVNTISLYDMLQKYNAPKVIDYLSIDTEGSEFEILKAFDFDEYDIRVITCEHNFTPMRDEIFKLLSANGYVRKYSELSRFDDWYVRE